IVLDSLVRRLPSDLKREFAFPMSPRWMATLDLSFLVAPDFRVDWRLEEPEPLDPPGRAAEDALGTPSFEILGTEAFIGPAATEHLIAVDRRAVAATRVLHRLILHNWRALDTAITANGASMSRAESSVYLPLGIAQCVTTRRWPGTPLWCATVAAEPPEA